MKKIFVVVLVMAFVATAGLAMAQGWGRGPGMGYGPGMRGYGPTGPCAGGPAGNLNAEQMQKMQELREGFLKDTALLRNELVTKRLELRALWVQTDPDQEKIMVKQKEVNALREQLQEKTTKHRLQARQILTPEQRAQWGANFGRMGYGPKRGPRTYGPGYGMGPSGPDCPRW